jgi:hypothetical protein
MTALGPWFALPSGRWHVEDLVQSRDRKDLAELGTQVANGHVPTPGKFLAQADQRAEQLAGDVLHVGEVEEQVGTDGD